MKRAHLLFTNFLIALLTFGAGIPIAFAQTSKDIFYKVKDRQNTELGEVRATIMDAEGLLWLGTSTGLYTYNGYDFEAKAYAQDPGHQDKLPILALYPDADNKTLWIGTDLSITKYDLKNGRAREMVLQEVGGPATKNYFQNFYQEVNGDVWVAAYNGLFHCPVESDTCYCWQVESARQAVLEDPYLNRMSCVIGHDHSDSLWVGALKGIYAFDKKSKKFQPYLKKLNNKPSIINALYNLDEVLVAGTYSEGVAIIRKDNKSATLFKLPIGSKNIEKPQPTIRSIVAKDENSLWLTAESGLHTFDLRTHSIQYYSGAAEPQFSEINPKSFSIQKDHLGHWWAGFENGLSQWDASRFVIQAKHINKIFEDPQQTQINQLAQNQNGEIMISAYRRGIFALKEDRFEMQDDSNNWPISPGPEFYELFPMQDSLWLFTDDKKLFGYDPFTLKKWLVLDEAEYKKGDLHLYLSHYYDKEKNVFWMGRQWGRGIAKINLQTGKTKLYDQNNFIPDSLITTTGFLRLAKDKNEDLWFTTGAGLCRLDEKTERIQRYGVADKNVGSNDCIGLAINSAGEIWTSFYSEGLFYYDEKEGQLQRAALKLGKQFEIIGDINFDQFGFLWAVSNLGLHRIDIATGRDLLFTKDNGLPTNNLYGTRLNQINDQFIGLQNRDWVAWIDLNKIQNNNQLIEGPKLTKLKVVGVDAHLLEPKSEMLTLTHTQNSLSFEFPLVNYKSPNLNNYRYKLSGLDEDWQGYDRSIQVQYNGLSAGNYSFEAQANFAHTGWSPSVRKSFRIKPPWWKTWWALTLAALLLLLAVWTFHRQRTHQIRKEAAIKSAYEIQLADLEMEALRSQMNPHFIFNALNSIKHFILSNDKFLAAEYLSNFSRLVRKILNNSKSAIITLDEEIETLKLYLEMEKLRFKTKFDYKIVMPPQFDLEQIKIPPLILQPYVENAIWHGIMHKENKGHLIIEINKEKENIVCVIEDDGIGRKKAHEIKTKSVLKKKSFGMQITKARIDRSSIKATSEIIDLVDEQGNALGTQVKIYIPLSNNN